MKAGLDFVHEFVPGSSKRTLLLLHGTGGNEHDLIPLDARLIQLPPFSVRAAKVLENGMPRFLPQTRRRVFDEEDLKRRTHELADFVGAAAQHYEFAADKIVAVGYSNGANIAASLLLLRPETLHAAVLFRAMVPLVPEKLPDLSSARLVDRRGKSGTPIIPISETRRLSNSFAVRGRRLLFVL